MPRSFEDSFNNIDHQRQLEFNMVQLTPVQAEFLRDYMRRHPDAVRSVRFRDCSFDSANNNKDNNEDSARVVEILKDCFAATLINVHVTPQTNDIRRSWFPSVVGFATQLYVSPRAVGDLTRIVDTIRGGNAKRNLREIIIRFSNIISSNDQALAMEAVTSLVEHTQLKELYLTMGKNIEMFNNHAVLQSLCNKLKKNKHLKSIALNYFVSSSASNEAHTAAAANATTVTTMFVKMLTVNTTLTHVSVGPIILSTRVQRNEIAHRRREDDARRILPWTRRNNRLRNILAGVQGLFVPPQNNSIVNNNNNIIINPDALVMRFLRVAMEDFDRDKSAAFLLIRNGIIGGHDSSIPLNKKICDFLKWKSIDFEAWMVELDASIRQQQREIDDLKKMIGNVKAENDVLQKTVETQKADLESARAKVKTQEAELDSALAKIAHLEDEAVSGVKSFMGSSVRNDE